MARRARLHADEPHHRPDQGFQNPAERTIGVAFRSASFGWLLASSLATYLGTGVQLTATAWLALDAGGAFSVGLVLAARMLPNLLFGLAAGTLADRGNRARLLALVRLLALPPALGLAWLSAAQPESVNVWLLVVLAFGTGCATVFDMPARQALVLDTVARDAAPNAMALNATASRLATAVGALLAGALIPGAGLPAAFVLAAATFALAALVGLLIRPATRGSTVALTARPTFTRAMRDALRLIADIAEVRILVAAAIACEIFGFSYQTAVPVFARDVLGAGAEGLGTLNAATSLGGALGLVTLALVPGRIRRQPILGLVFVAFGVSILVVAPSHSMQVAAAALLVTGACAASFDVLQQTLMQLAVPEAHRGRAVGLWVLSIGSAPVGNLEMGAVVAAFGAPAALAINGGLVLLAAVLLLAGAPSYRVAPRILYDRATSRRESEQ
ncbi:MAG: MFS transporter [Chloroflexi bacterium]|nr:MFS transporter [Chloroflexota bacterium]